jgi:DNA-binding transcriptional regulator YdaS (Cro superfamily)
MSKIKKQSLPGNVKARLEVWVESKLINWKGSSRLEAEDIIEMVEGVLTGQILPPEMRENKPWEKYSIQ